MHEANQQHQLIKSVPGFVPNYIKNHKWVNMYYQIFTLGIDDVLYIYNLGLPIAFISTQTVAMFIRKWWNVSLIATKGTTMQHLFSFSSLLFSSRLENFFAHFRDDDDDDDGDSPPPGTASITSFFAPKSDSVERRRHQFFLERHLEPIDTF